MKLEEQNILYFTRSMALGGTEKVILQLCEIFKPLVNKIVVCSYGGVNVEVLNNMGIKHYQIPDIQKKSLVNLNRTASMLRKIINDEEITLIHTHHRMAAFYVSVLRLYENCAFFNTSHNTFYNKKGMTKFAYKHANLIACGEMVKKNLTEEFDLPTEQIKVIHNAVKSFNGVIQAYPKIAEWHSEGYTVIGNIGRLSEQKGMEYFIKAVPMILEKHPMTRFLIVGTGNREQQLIQLVKDLDLEESIVFAGYRTDIQNIMSQLDFVVLSSLWEGLPLTPIEAFSVGKTIVATAVDGTPEIVKDGNNGLLIEKQNSKQLAEKVMELLDNSELREKLEKNALSTFKEEFSFEAYKEKYIQAYQTF